jgi:hypothetical protein
MYQLDYAQYMDLLASSSQIGTLAWLVSSIIGLLIGPLGLMVGVRVFGSKEASYGKCFMTYIIVWAILLLLSASMILGLFLGAIVVLVIMLVLVIFICCLYPKMVSSRHDLQSWFKGLIAIIIAAIVSAIINWVLGLFLYSIIPDIILFTF